MEEEQLYEFGEDFFEELTDLASDLLAHLKLDSTIQGWLLTLSDEQFNILQHEMDYIETDFDKAKNFFYIIIINFFGGMPILGESYISESELSASLKSVIVSVALIANVKDGNMVYVPKSDDGDWEYEMTELGKQRMAELNKTQ